ncbi:MAG TPA: response regulator [Anaeromyxobacteraceae bacterium]|nr:response regulator [Anaeromyxobacteraceae bacterium]
MRVLIADETGAVAARGLVFLTLWGNEVETADDGLEALRRVRQWRPDLVVAAAVLPRMDGVSLAAAIRARTETNHVAVIVAGGEGTDARERAEAIGAYAWVPLPLDVPELQRVVVRLAAASQRRTVANTRRRGRAGNQAA